MYRSMLLTLSVVLANVIHCVRPHARVENSLSVVITNIRTPVGIRMVLKV